MAVRRVADQPFTPGRAPAQPRQIGFRGRLVDEDQPRGIEPALLPSPPPPGPRHVRPVLLGRMERLFLYVSFSLANTWWIAATVQVNPSRAFISARVRSGSFATSACNAPPCSGSNLALRPQNRYRGRKSPVRSRCCNNFLTMPRETLNRLATSSLVPSFRSYASTMRSRKSNEMGFLIPTTYHKRFAVAITLFKMLLKQLE